MSALRRMDTYSDQPLAVSAIEDHIGNTPLIGFKQITRHLPDDVQVFAKAEWHNPGGSVKDRPAREIVHQALADGRLGRGKILLDSTSGNTGIAYAMLGASLGFPVKLFMSEAVSKERVAILRAYGVEIVFTDPLEGSDGAIEAVRELVEREPERYFYADQYNNPANWQAHYKTTGVEIWEQTQGRVTHFIAGLGTSGTLMGTGRRLRAYNPDIQIISSQPDIAFHGIEGWKHMPTAILPGIYDDSFADRDMGVSTEASYEMTRRLAREEGYLVGPSAGAALVSALTLAEELAELGQAGVIVTVFPDNAYKYLSSDLWHS
ncbi:MAG: PLP-dependent cysteine synthase family protein [Anaerolineae bacterium]